MTAQHQFEQIKQLLRAGEHEPALAALDQLLTSRPNAAALHWHRANCLEALDRLDEALAATQRTLQLKADYAPAWLKQAELASSLDEDYPHYGRDVAKALACDPGFAKAHAADAMLSYNADDRDGAFAKLAKAIALAPDDHELRLMRASWHESGAFEPESEADALPQFNGMQFSRRKLELADVDYSAVLDQQPTLTRPLIKRAQLRHKLGRFDAALQDYDQALSLLKADDPLHEIVRDLRRNSENNGAGERDAVARMMENALGELSADERQQLGASWAASAVRSAAASMRSGQNMTVAMEQFISDDPDDLLAVDIAYKIHAQGNEPDPEYAAATANEFSKDQQAFAASAGKQLQKQGFVALGDYDPLHLEHMLNRRTLVRVFRSDDGQICAASFKLKPSWPGWLAFIILKLTGKWQEPAVVDFESELSDGHFLVTNNSSQLNPFGTGSQIDSLALPLKTSIADVLAAHRTRLAAYLQSHAGVQPIALTDIDSVFALQARLGACKRDYRRSIGYISDAELRQLLGPRHDELQEKVRQKLQLLMATDQED